MKPNHELPLPKSAEKATAIVDSLNELLKNLNSSVRIECGSSSDLFYIEVTDDWTNWSTVQFTGSELSEVLEVAVKAKNAVLNPPHTGGSPVNSITKEEK